jgi:hypothetical protein
MDSVTPFNILTVVVGTIWTLSTLVWQGADWRRYGR